MVSSFGKFPLLKNMTNFEFEFISPKFIFISIFHFVVGHKKWMITYTIIPVIISDMCFFFVKFIFSVLCVVSIFQNYTKM